MVFHFREEIPLGVSAAPIQCVALYPLFISERVRPLVSSWPLFPLISSANKIKNSKSEFPFDWDYCEKSKDFCWLLSKSKEWRKNSRFLLCSTSSISYACFFPWLPSFLINFIRLSPCACLPALGEFLCHLFFFFGSFGWVLKKNSPQI